MKIKKHNIKVWYISLFLQLLALTSFYLLVGEWINQYNSYFANFIVTIIPFLSAIIYWLGFYLYWFLIVLWTYFLHRKNYNPYKMPKRFIAFNLMFLIFGSFIGLIAAISISLVMKNEKDENYFSQSSMTSEDMLQR